MRGVQIPLNTTQKLRLERTLERLESLSSKSIRIPPSASPIPFRSILKTAFSSHGTSEIDGRVVATVCGVVERVNKLVYVRALRSRYKPEVGDIIVGRVTEVAPKRWRLEVNFSQGAVLMVSSMNLPDGIQRRRTAVDELNMRCIVEESDVICAEVRGFQHDGLHLQARSQKYGKLERGQLLSISPYLLKRRKQHSHHLDRCGIDLILGCNGYIWVGEHAEAKDDMVEDQVDKSEQQSANSEGSVTCEQEKGHTPLEIRQYICRVANAVCVCYPL